MTRLLPASLQPIVRAKSFGLGLKDKADRQNAYIVTAIVNAFIDLD